MSQRALKAKKGYDWITLSIFIALVFIGWLMLYATVYDENANVLLDLKSPVIKQAIWIGISLFALICVSMLDWKIWSTFSYPIYGITLFLLLAVLIFGTEIKGAKSWFSFGGFSFQPSELSKFGTALALSSYLSSYKTNIKQIKDQAIAFGIILLPMGLIFLQPDAGSAIVFLSFSLVLYKNGLTPLYYLIGFSLIIVFVSSLIFNAWITTLIIFLIGLSVLVLNLKHKKVWTVVLILIFVASIYCFYLGYHLYTILGLFALVIMGALALYRERKQSLAYVVIPSILLLVAFSFGSRYAFENFLKPHQQDRVNVWLRPHLCDPQGSLYNIIQSKTAIGSGGFQGKGFLEGTMTRLNYVPEQMTDFIFTTVGEEQGFVGASCVIILYLVLLLRISYIAQRARSEFISNYAYCVAGLIFIHFFINIGMTLGIMPVIGIPLPFLSKGGSSLLIFTLMIGILLRMDTARYRI